MFRLRLVFVMVMIFAFAVAGMPTAAQEGGEGPARVGLRPDAPTYALHGPYWVGTREFVIDEGADDAFSAVVWYPAVNPDAVEEVTSYPFQWKIPMPLPSDAAVQGRAIRDAVLDSATAPFPLIVFSHGFAVAAVSYVYIPEHLASYGFVVIAPDHRESMDEQFTFSDLWKSSIDRPRDIRRVLDFAETLTEQGGAMQAMIDMEHVAVAGHSYGGYTALAAAGARFDLKGFNARCEAARAAEDPNTWLCDPLQPHEAEMAERAGLGPMPEGLWPSMGDARVDAIIPMAGDSYLFDREGLASITAPILAMGGTNDSGTPFMWGAEPAFQSASSAQKSLVAIENAEHMVFGIACHDAPFLAPMGLTGFCADPVWDMDRAHDLINHFTTAFLLDVLKGDAEAHAALLPDAVSFPGITYETTMH